MKIVRSPLMVSISVWKALFLRESVTRLSMTRAAWMWLLFEPMVQIILLMFIFSVVRMRVVGGMGTAVWVMVGLLAFFMFRRTATQVMNAVHPSQALFTYRQVKPVDTTLVRAVLEGFLTIIISIILFSGSALLGLDIVPDNMLLVLLSFFGLWLNGVGFGLIASVATELIPEMGKIIGLLMMPLYFLSGVIFPITAVPQPYLDFLLFNPLLHAVEAVRLGFSNQYHVVSELSVSYVYGFALILVFFGLALHVKFALRIQTQ